MSKPVQKRVWDIVQPFVLRHRLTVRQTKTHLQVRHPVTGRCVTVSVSPSDYRAYLNIRRDLRRLTGEV